VQFGDRCFLSTVENRPLRSKPLPTSVSAMGIYQQLNLRGTIQRNSGNEQDRVGNNVEILMTGRCAELHLSASGMRYADRDFEKAESSDSRSDALCFLAHVATIYLPVLTNWMQSPWFLKL
jgi:hypothetical protein